MSMKKLATLAAVCGVSSAATCSNDTRVVHYEPVYTNGSIPLEHLSTPGNLDGFRTTVPSNRKSADFWYFDVFSASTNETLNIVFFNSGWFSQYPHPLSVQVSGTFANGTDFYYEAMADDGVTMTHGPNGITGDWKGIGSFKGSALDKPDIEYTINLDSPEMDISGSIVFKSIAPPRYPCDLNGAIGANQNLVPGLYWANALPDADTTVDLTVKDTRIAFSGGVGYHDKNWANKQIVDGPKYWDWGHGRFGPWSVVWYNMLDYEGVEHRKSFVYKDGEVQLLSCDPAKMEVRQMGGKAAWPPTTGLLETEGLTVNYTLANGDKLSLEIATELIVRDEHGAYQRGDGKITGGIVGGETYEGKAHYEEFIFGVVNDYTPME